MISRKKNTSPEKRNIWQRIPSFALNIWWDSPSLAGTKTNWHKTLLCDTTSIWFQLGSPILPRTRGGTLRTSPNSQVPQVLDQWAVSPCHWAKILGSLGNLCQFTNMPINYILWEDFPNITAHAWLQYFTSCGCLKACPNMITRWSCKRYCGFLWLHQTARKLLSLTLTAVKQN